MVLSAPGIIADHTGPATALQAQQHSRPAALSGPDLTSDIWGSLLSSSWYKASVTDTGHVIYQACIYNIVRVFAPVSASTHLQPACPSIPVPMWATAPSSGSFSYWTLASSTCSSAIRPSPPSTLKAPSFLGPVKLVNEDWEVLKSCTTPGQEPAVFRTWPVNVLSARQVVRKPLLTYQWLQRRQHTGAHGWMESFAILDATSAGSRNLLGPCNWWPSPMVLQLAL